MAPILFRLHGTEFSVALPHALLLLAFCSAVLAAVAWKKRAREGAIFSGLAAFAAAGSAVALWGRAGHLGPVSVSSYGALLALSVLSGWWLSVPLAGAAGISKEQVGSAAVSTLIGAILGARLLYLVAYSPAPPWNWAALDWTQGGLSGDGAVIGGLLGSWVSFRKAREDWWKWADALAPSWGLALALLSFGSYLSGSGFGFRLAFEAPRWFRGWTEFPHWSPSLGAGLGSPAWAFHLQQGWISPQSPQSLPVHPVQLYSAALGLGLVAVAAFHQARRSASPAPAVGGRGFLTVAFAYGTGRFFLERWVEDPSRWAGGAGAINLSSGFGLLLALAAALAWRRGNPPGKVAAAIQSGPVSPVAPEQLPGPPSPSSRDRSSPPLKNLVQAPPVGAVQRPPAPLPKAAEPAEKTQKIPPRSGRKSSRPSGRSKSSRTKSRR